MPKSYEMTFDEMALQVMETLDGIEADVLVKVFEVMCNATVVWDEDHDCYLVSFHDDKPLFNQTTELDDNANPD